MAASYSEIWRPFLYPVADGIVAGLSKRTNEHANTTWPLYDPVQHGCRHRRPQAMHWEPYTAQWRGRPHSALDEVAASIGVLDLLEPWSAYSRSLSLYIPVSHDIQIEAIPYGTGSTVTAATR